MVELFRHCPGCGRRFHIKLVEKDELGSYDTESEGPLRPIRSGRGVLSPDVKAGPTIALAGGGAVSIVQEGPTMYFDIREFAYHYKCKHCGHEWTETREEDKPIEVDMDPIND